MEESKTESDLQELIRERKEAERELVNVQVSVNHAQQMADDYRDRSGRDSLRTNQGSYRTLHTEDIRRYAADQQSGVQECPA